MIHLRLVSPSDATGGLLQQLETRSGVLDVVVQRGAAHHPAGDVIHLDVLNGAANAVIDDIRAAGITTSGSVVIEVVDGWMSDAGREAEADQSRFEARTPVWALIDARIRAGSTYAPSWFGLLAIAGVIAAIGILTNSQILIVGAMVVGPEYDAMISIARAGIRRERAPVVRGLRALVIGFAGAILAAATTGALVRARGITPEAFARGLRPVSDLINTPNAFSLSVAVLAGVVGVISLTESRPSTLIGVFITVTTIPAAADLGLSASYGEWTQARGSLLQLLANVTILIVVGMVALVAQERVWRRASARRARRTGRVRPGRPTTTGRRPGR